MTGSRVFRGGHRGSPILGLSFLSPFVGRVVVVVAGTGVGVDCCPRPGVDPEDD